ncbi:uncharacterized protein LOC117112846 isoform X2 [Anneissia japonica]|uniref:uncharacterized protein LOC117112846 isoform X2 n=1 Tax=Anneissia japonica TaxID=1529436 RepID=UPI0014255D07|nr:uncharacterized protein LOC117112846 isoform X2 [Anneissia japonica]
MSDSEVARESHDSETFEIIGDERDVVPDKSVVEEEEVMKENGDVDILHEDGDVYNGESDLTKQNGIGQHGPVDEEEPVDEPEDDQLNDEAEVREVQEILEPELKKIGNESEEVVEQVVNEMPEVTASEEDEEKEDEGGKTEESVEDIPQVEIEVTKPPVQEPERQDEKETELRRKFDKSIVVKPRIPSNPRTEKLSIASRLALFEQACKGSSENSETVEGAGEKSELHKLEGSKFSHFEDKENETKENEEGNKPKRGPSRRLDKSRFSRFEQKTADSTDSVPAWKKNRGSVNSSAAAKKFAAQNQDASSSNCKVCNKKVYPMERLAADGAVYHKSCFKCTECKATLRLGNFAMAKGQLFCKPHYKQLFKLKGNYDDGFTPGANRPEFSVGEENTSPSTNGVSQNAIKTSEQDAEEVFDLKNRRSRFDGTEQTSTTVIQKAGPPVDFPVAGSDGQIAESEPIQRTDVVREGDAAEKTSVGSMRSLKDRFEQGKVSNVEVRKSFDPENDKVVVESDGTSHVSENQPVVLEGVVTSSQELAEACTMEGGMRAVKDRFESGKVSETTEKKTPEPIDLTSEISNTSIRNSILAENEPIIRDGVVRSGDDMDEVKVITGGIGSLKNRFEKGSVSNVEAVRKQEPERVIRSLENYTENESSVGHVAESTPIERNDITRESTEVDDGISQGGAKSLRDIFEKGNVSNLAEKTKDKIELKSEIEGAGQVAESQPIVRSDVVKADMEMSSNELNVGVSKSLKNKFEKGEVHNVEETPKSELERPPRSLDEFASGDSQVSENIPAPPIEGIIRSSMADDSVDSIEGGTRNLKEKFEKGEVNVDKDNKHLDGESKSIDLYKSEDGQVAENEPLVREGVDSGSSDLIEPMSPAAGAVNLKNKWEKGEVHNAEVAKPKLDMSPRRLTEVNGNEEINGGENGWTQDCASVEIKASRSVVMEQEDL